MESYKIKYWIKVDKYFKQETRMMTGYSGRNDHKKVEKDFLKLYPNAEIVSISYQ